MKVKYRMRGILKKSRINNAEPLTRLPALLLPLSLRVPRRALLPLSLRVPRRALPPPFLRVLLQRAPRESLQVLLLRTWFFTCPANVGHQPSFFLTLNSPRKGQVAADLNLGTLVLVRITS